MEHLEVSVLSNDQYLQLASNKSLSEALNFPGKTSHNSSDPNQSVVKATCLLPQYQIYTWVLAMVCLGTFLKLSYLIKWTILLAMVIVYTILMTVAYPEVFDDIQVRLRFSYIFIKLAFH